MSSELIPVDLESVTAIAIFEGEGLDELLGRIDEEARSLAPDVSTKKGRDAVASNAYRVARSKSYLDALGKDHVAELKAKAKVIDEKRRLIRERLDNLKSDVRKPLDEWEATEKQRVDRIKSRIEAMSEPWSGTSEAIKDEIARLESVEIDDTFAEFKADAALAKDAALGRGRLALQEVLNAEQAERDRIAEQQRLQQEREARIAAEAAERAKREAEALARAEAQKAERQRLEAEQRAADAKRAAEEAEARRAKEAEEAEARRVREAEQAKLQREAAEQAAAKAERDRIEARIRAEGEAARQRQADKEHRVKIDLDVLAALKEFASLDDDSSKQVLRAIQLNYVPHVSISY